MSNRARNALWRQWQDQLLTELKAYPEGIDTKPLADALGITITAAANILSNLSKQRLIGRRFIKRPRQKAKSFMWLSVWLPDPAAGQEENPYIVQRTSRYRERKAKQAAQAALKRPVDAEQYEWHAKITALIAEKKRYNPWERP